MIEGFKLTAIPIKRNLKISVCLPKDYNYTDKKYPAILFLDGQNYFNYIMENTLTLDVAELIKDKEIIAIGIQAPTNPDWRTSELNEFYTGDNENVDSSYSVAFTSYIINELIPLIKRKYRITTLNVLGYKEAAIEALCLGLQAPDLDGAFILSASLRECDMNKLINKIDDSIQKKNQYYLYLGGINTLNDDLNRFMSIYTALDKLRCPNINLIYEEARGNEFNDHTQEIISIINNT